MNLGTCLGTRRCRIVSLIVLFVISLSLRLWWTLFVQRPQDVIFSDMAGYIERAQLVASGLPERYYADAVLPYGTHYLYAAEMRLWGMKDYIAMAVTNAIFGAICVVAITLAANYIFPSDMPVILVGVMTCVWYPLISYNGFFSSETPFAMFMCLSVLCTFRLIKTGKGGILTGFMYGIAFTLRPQVILTFALVVAWLMFRRLQIARYRIRTIAALIAPVAIIVALSAYRYHYLTGEWALISGNGPVTKLFGATRYKSCLAYETQNGAVVGSIGFGPPSSYDLGLTESFSFEGRIIDANIIKQEIKSYQSKLTLWEKIFLKVRNVALLAYMNRMWPEFVLARHDPDCSAWRYWLFTGWHMWVRFYWVPVACLGLIIAIRQKNIYLEVILLNIFTMLYAAYAYIGEIRYRVPYDPLINILFIIGIATLFSRWHWLPIRKYISEEHSGETLTVPQTAA